MNIKKLGQLLELNNKVESECYYNFDGQNITNYQDGVEYYISNKTVDKYIENNPTEYCEIYIDRIGSKFYYNFKFNFLITLKEFNDIIDKDYDIELISTDKIIDLIEDYSNIIRNKLSDNNEIQMYLKYNEVIKND